MTPSDVVPVRLLRVSSQEQADRNISIPAQRDTIVAFEHTHGLKSVGEYSDEGAGAWKKGSNEKRDSFQLLINDAQSPNCTFNTVLVYSFDRFCREFEDSFYYEILLKKNGVRLVAVTEDPEKLFASEEEDETKLLVNRFEWFWERHRADDESRRTSQRIKRSFDKLARDGYFPTGKAPLGYKFVKVPEGKHFRRKLEIDDEQKAIPLRVKELLLSGHSLKDICHTLEREGFRPLRAKFFFPSTLHQIATNEHYLGVTIWRRNKENALRIENTHPALFTQEEFDQMKEILTSRHPEKWHPRFSSGKYLLSGLAWCAKCGYRYAPRSSYRNYGCTARMHAGRCDMPHAPIKKIEDGILRWLGQHMQDEEALRQDVEAVNSALADKAADPTHQQRLRLTGTIEDKEKAVQRLLAAIEKGVAEETVFSRINDLQAEIAAHKVELDSLPPSALTLEPVRIEDVQQYAQHILTTLAAATLEEKRLLVREFIERIDVAWPLATIHSRVNGRPAGKYHVHMLPQLELPSPGELPNVYKNDVVKLLRDMKERYPEQVQCPVGQPLYELSKVELMAEVEKYRHVFESVTGHF